VNILCIVGTNYCFKEFKLLCSAGQKSLHKTVTFFRSTLFRVLST